MKKAYGFWGSVAIGLLFIAPVAAQTPTESLQKSLNAVNTYEASFHQQIKDAHGAVVSNASGSVQISRPNQFYWKSEKPDPIIVIADGKHLWNYDVDLAQVTQQDLKPVMKNSPAGILAGDAAQLTDSFTVELGKAKQCHGKTDQCFVLKPKDSDAGYSQVVLGFQQGKLVEIKMQDGLGQDVQTQFTQVKINHPIEAKRFQFKPPKGVDIIRQ